MSGDPEANARLARNPGGPRLRVALGVLAGAYLAALWLDSAGASRQLDTLLPRPARFFTQAACLFPRTAINVIEYRATGFDCATGQFRELDLAPLFPIHPFDEENPFHRAMFFYRHNRPTLQALDEYITNGHNGLAAGGRATDGVGRVGGVMLLSLRLPLPALGQPPERYVWRPLAQYPTEVRSYWYRTPRERLLPRCAEAP